MIQVPHEQYNELLADAGILEMMESDDVQGVCLAPIVDSSEVFCDICRGKESKVRLVTSAVPVGGYLVVVIGALCKGCADTNVMSPEGFFVMALTHRVNDVIAAHNNNKHHLISHIDPNIFVKVKQALEGVGLAHLDVTQTDEFAGLSLEESIKHIWTETSNFVEHFNSELPPTLTITFEDGDSWVMNVESIMHDENLVRSFALDLRSKKPIKYAHFICEGWLAVVDSKDDLNGILTPSEMPGRQEVLLLISGYKDDTVKYFTMSQQVADTVDGRKLLGSPTVDTFDKERADGSKIQMMNLLFA